MTEGFKDKPQFILASSSPRRQQLLGEAGYRFDVVDPPLEEPDERHKGLAPAQLAEALAYFKARAVAEGRGYAQPVLAADTVVALGEQVIGKPIDADDARRILSSLAGTQHEVITGVALVAPGGRRALASRTTRVRMRELSPDQIGQYISTGLWEGKAGAYGIQDGDDAFVEAIDGSFSNVVGLPMELVPMLLEMLENEADKDFKSCE